MEFPSIDRSFFLGACFDAYRTLGAPPCRGERGEEGWRFAVWAPGAVAVEVCGGFDGWGPGVPMQRAETGIWNGFVAGLQEGEMYKFRIHGRDGSTVMRADPYAFCHRAAPGTASILTKLDFPFDDAAWMQRRDKCRNLPLNIYELHAGSWKHTPQLHPRGRLRRLVQLPGAGAGAHPVAAGPPLHPCGTAAAGRAPL